MCEVFRVDTPLRAVRDGSRGDGTEHKFVGSMSLLNTEIFVGIAASAQGVGDRKS